MIFADSVAPHNTRVLSHRARSQSYQQHHQNTLKDVGLNFTSQTWKLLTQQLLLHACSSSGATLSFTCDDLVKTSPTFTLFWPPPTPEGNMWLLKSYHSTTCVSPLFPSADWFRLELSPLITAACMNDALRLVEVHLSSTFGGLDASIIFPNTFKKTMQMSGWRKPRQLHSHHVAFTAVIQLCLVSFEIQCLISIFIRLQPLWLP